MDDGRSRPLDLPLSNRLIGRAAAVMFFICGVVSIRSVPVWIEVWHPCGATTRIASRLAAVYLIPLWASDHQRLPTVSWVE